MKRKFKWGIIIVVILVIILAVFLSLSKQDTVEYITANVGQQDIMQTVEVTGSIEAADNIDLNFTTTGTLSQMLAKVGQEVTKGEILAALSAGDINSQVANARAALDLTRSQLDELLAGASTQDIGVSQEEKVQTQTAYQTALDDLANLEVTRDNELDSLQSIALNTMADKYFIAQYSLDVVYDVIIDTTAESDFYVSDLVLLNQAKAYYNTAKLDYNSIESLIDAAQFSSEQDDILMALDQLEIVLEEVSDSLTSSFASLLTVVYNGVYTETVVATHKTTINTQTTAINTAIASVQDAASDIRTRGLYYDSQIIQANNNILAKLSALHLAQARLDLKTAPPRSFEIAAKEAQVRQAQATLNRYLSNLSETVIKAPVDGVVTDINFDQGEQTSFSSPVISMIGLSQLQIEVYVPESDITKIEPGDSVNITLDAFSNDDAFVGTVTFIDPAATVINDVIYYKVKVSLDVVNDKIKSGMTADLTIQTDSRPDVISVPSRAVVYKDGKKYVQVLENGQAVEKEISTGLRGDDGFIEIISGLSINEEVITFVKNGE
jgi:multidrug efflux pump subunit AcrA (membrane-fusion protein)